MITLPHMTRQIIITLILCILLPYKAYAGQPIATDSRIKTLVYSASEVFPVTAHFGYHAYIEFAKGEKIEAVSLGNNVPWRVTPMENRLFLKPKDGYSHTNMTVLTSQRSYEFDLTSKLPPEEKDANLTYVTRFYYPDDSFDRIRLTEGAQHSTHEMPMPPGEEYNFNYSLVGPDNLAPIKVFDNNQETYFQFAGNNAVLPSIAIIEFDGSETPLSVKRQGDFVVVDRVASQFSLRMSQKIVCVFNENNYGTTAQQASIGTRRGF